VSKTVLAAFYVIAVLSIDEFDLITYYKLPEVSANPVPCRAIVVPCVLQIAMIRDG
jgi:hypothetical protein